MNPLIPIVAIAITFGLIFILNREGRKMGTSVHPLAGCGIAVIILFFVWLAFYVKQDRDRHRNLPLEQVRVTKLLPLEQAYCLSDLDDSMRKNILGLTQLSEGITEERMEKSLRDVYAQIEPDGLIEWSINKIQHLENYSAGATVHDITLNPEMGGIEKAMFHQLLDAHAIPRQITLLDIILDTYVAKQRERYRSSNDKDSVRHKFDKDIERVKAELTDIKLQAKPWSRLSLEDDLK